MQIIPKISHFKVVTYCNLLCGVWPIAFENHPLLRVLYNTYFWTLFSVTSLFIICAYIKLFSEMFTNFDIVIVTRIGTIATAYTMGLLRIYSVRNTAAKELIREVMMKEEIINNSEDEELIKIYCRCVRGNVLLNLVYMTMHYIDTISYCYVIYPFLIPKEPYFDPERNKTVLQTPLLWESWMPFDQQKYHFVAFFWEEFASTVCALCNYGSDIFFYSYINYLIGQLDILHRILSGFETYKGKIQEQLRCDEEEADLVTLRLCIIEHQRILSYINKFNETMRSVMLMDFLQSSLQLAMLTLFVMNVPDIFTKLATSLFGIISLGRLAIYYWYANEIMIKSNFTEILYNNIKWYEKSKKFNTLLKIFIMKTNVSTGLQIGTLTTMSWQIFFGVLKTAYSFLTFVLQTRT